MDDEEDDPQPDAPSTDRRTVLKGMAAAATWGALSRALPEAAGSTGDPVPANPLALERGAQRFQDDFSRPDGDTWGPPWTIDGVANTEIHQERGRLEAGTNIYPSDRRGVAFARDLRVLDGTVTARFARTGVGAGLVLRRTAPMTHYAAVLDREDGALKLLSRSPDGETVLARNPVQSVPSSTLTLSFQARGSDPTTLRAALGLEGADEAVVVQARDGTDALQAPGDPGVLSTSETGFRAGPDWRTDLGSQSVRGLWVVDAVTDARGSRAPITEVREAATEQSSTAVVEEVTVHSSDDPEPTTPSTVAAQTLQPVAGGARVGVSADVPGTQVEIEVARDPGFANVVATVPAGEVDDLLGSFTEIAGLDHDVPLYWRPRLTREDTTAVGPTRRFRALPQPGDGAPVRMAVGGCATQFSTTFPAVAEDDPDVFVWEGDLNYIDASGPLAQTDTGYAGMWKDILNTPELEPILEDACFAATRDDHDYGLNDCWRETLTDHGVAAWDQVMNPDPYYDFRGGHLHAWVLDTRRWRDDPADPDDEDKTLLGPDQLTWLETTLQASPALFKLVCSPGPLFNVPNDSTSWAKGYTTERDAFLEHVRDNVDGEVVFVTGDTHSGAVSRDQGVWDFRAAPMDIPGPGRHDPSSGDTVLFSKDGKFYCLVDVGEEAGSPTMTVQLKRNDGSVAWEETFTA
jgi:hypothetical protein